MENINLNDFFIEMNENGSFIGNGDNVCLKNLTTGEVVVAPFADVAKFYGFVKLNQKPEAGALASLLEGPQTKASSTKVKAQSSVRPVNEFKWDFEQIKFILNSYIKFMNSVGPLKQFQTENLMWTHIANQLNEKFKAQINGKQVQIRYHCVIKRTENKPNDKNTTWVVREEMVNVDDKFDNLPQDDWFVVLSPGKCSIRSNVFPGKVIVKECQGIRPAAVPASSQCPSSRLTLAPSQSTLFNVGRLANRPQQLCGFEMMPQKANVFSDRLTMDASQVIRSAASSSQFSSSGLSGPRSYSTSDSVDRLLNPQQRIAALEMRVQKLMDRKLYLFHEYCQMKEKRYEERQKERRRRHDKKLQILRDLLAAIKKT